MAERFRCSVASAALGEPCYGTASRSRRWILVEQPGSWGAAAVTQSRLPLDVAIGLQAVARAAGARLVLIRRFGRSQPTRRSAFAVVSTAELRRVEHLTFDDPAELLDVDWSPLRILEPIGGDVVDEPLYLVCTNGKHDACCAEFGRPVAQAMTRALGSMVWEVSHIGGDRFAGNLVVLPDGTYYGRITPDNALRVVDAHANGQLDLAHYRGRSFLDFPVQAAEHLTREALGLTGVDDVVVRDVEHLDDEIFRVTIQTPETVVTAVVACSPAVDPQQLTCGSSSEEHPPRYRLVELD